MRPALLPLPPCLALLLAGAYFARTGWPALGFACGVLAAAAWSRQAWVRFALLAALPLLSAYWIQAALSAAQAHAMAEICGLISASCLTAFAALSLSRRNAGERWNQRRHALTAQITGLCLCLALLLPLWIMKPQFLLFERFVPQGGLAQTVLAGLWAILSAGWLSDGKSAPAARLRLWRLFSSVFFAQLALGLLVDGRFLFSGKLHLPVPGLIAAAPLYRGGGWFMLGLFGFSVALAGAAWCSQLCYFGVWDAAAAAGENSSVPLKQAVPQRRSPAWLPCLRLAMLAAAILTPLALRTFGAPVPWALAAGIILGLGIIPCAGWISRRAGYPAYCRGICPLGLLALWLGKLAPWRVRLAGDCVSCMACVKVCRQDAMTPEDLARGRPNGQCNLCLDCVNVCPKQALAVTFYGSPRGAAFTGALFTGIVAGLHAAFLAMARI